MLRNLPIKRKLTLLVMVPGVLALLITGLAVMALDEIRWQPAAFFAGLLAVFLLLTLMFATRLQQYISGPIQHLAEVAGVVARQRDYSVRAVKHGEDEVGRLIDTFNHMLDEIQRRDQALDEARVTLEHRVAERTREQTEALSLLNATLESTADGILAVDIHGRPICHNRSYAELYGLPPEHFQRKNPEEILDFAAQQTVDPQQYLARVREIQAAPEKEYFDVLEFKNGRIVERVAKPQWISQQCVGVVLNFRDITEHRRAETERQQAEAALRESQSLYRSLVEHMPAGIFRKDSEGRYVLVNSWFCQFKGLAENDFLGRTPAEFAAFEIAEHEADTKSVSRLAGQGSTHHEIIMRTGQPIELEEYYPDADHHGRYLQVVKTPVYGSEGKITGTQGIIFDITKSKLAEAALAKERGLLHTLLENSPDHIYFKDRESRFLKCSRRLAERFGRRHPDELVGKTDFDFFADAHARPAFLDEQKILRTGEPLIGKVEKEVWKTGEESWVITSKVPLRDENNEIIGTFGISKDITVIKETEAKLEIANRQLIETSRQAGMAEVATSVLHNVGNVLNSVNTSAGLIAEKLRASKMSGVGRVARLFDDHYHDLPAYLAVPGRVEQLRSYLKALAEHLAADQSSLLNELQDLTRNIEHIKDIVAMQQNFAKVSGVKETVKVADLIEDAVRMNASALTRHEVAVVRELEQPEQEITVEKHKVLQILVNLIRNAKIACDESGREDKRLSLHCARRNDRIRISVADNGVGIEAKNLTRIFNHGFTTRKNGHGFGLHSGALAAREMGGALRVESEGPGKGATFTLELPGEAVAQ